MKEHGLVFPITLFLFQILLLGLFAGYVEYDFGYQYKTLETLLENISVTKTHEPKSSQDFYTSFQDVHVMIFIGFGFLMTFLKKYGFGSVGYNMLLSCITIQWATLLNAWIRQRISYEEHPLTRKLSPINGKEISPGTIRVGLYDLMTADFTCAAILITFGALLGKASRFQLFLIVIFECIFFAINENVLVEFINVRDSGGSIVVHEFGAYFGLAVSFVIQNTGKKNDPNEGSVYHSDVFAMIGTLFLWVFWPSFNSGPVSDDPDLQRIAIVNTYFALSSCVVATFVASAMVNSDKGFKLDMVHIQNATIAGGVAVGTSADLMIQPWGAILIGMLAGVLSVVGYRWVTPFLFNKLRIHDTCGVNNLHGMPAIFAGICGAVAAAAIDSTGIYPESRNLTQRGGYQFAAVVISFAIAVFGGLLTGVLIKYFNKPAEEVNIDDPEWMVPDPEVLGMSGKDNKAFEEFILNHMQTVEVESKPATINA